MALKPKYIAVIFILILSMIIVFHLTPGGAIRFYIAFHGNPFAAVKAIIIPGYFLDCGWQYIVEGYNDRETGEKLCFFYLRKNAVGLWVVTSVGTGP
ncbi:MAG: hypothetical protein ACPLRZ_05310 [Thermovenabulum sp.]|uniref:hypothetical protein n=1 Tax=Thermovenabulum sp. TaxID=3100335 RepID=UPI003C7ED2BE